MTDEQILGWLWFAVKWLAAPGAVLVLVRIVGGKGVLFLLKAEKSAFYEWQRREVFDAEMESRAVLETQVGELRERAAGNARAIESIHSTLDSHAQQLRDVPDMSRTMKHLTETLQRIDEAQTKRDERQQEYALKITSELGRLSGVVDRLASEWDGRTDRRSPSPENATRRATFSEDER